jgi:hypothetical protein
MNTAAITSEESNEITCTYINLANLFGRDPTVKEVQKETHVEPARVERFIRRARRQKMFGFR